MKHSIACAVGLAVGIAFGWYVVGPSLFAQSPGHPNPCTAWTFKTTKDSIYAELQAPRGTKVCTQVVIQ